MVSVWPDQLSQIPAYQEECVGSESYSGMLMLGSRVQVPPGSQKNKKGKRTATPFTSNELLIRVANIVFREYSLLAEWFMHRSLKPGDIGSNPIGATIMMKLY